MKKSGKADEIGVLLSQGMESDSFKNTYKTTISVFIICAAVVMVIFFYFLIKVFDSVCEYRNIDIGVRYVLGYRKDRVRKDELCYGLKRIAAAEVLATAISAVVFAVINNIDVVESMIRSAGMNIFKAGVCIISLIVVAAVMSVDIVIWVERKYKYSKE
jgi:hypothetical protein